MMYLNVQYNSILAPWQYSTRYKKVTCSDAAKAKSLDQDKLSNTAVKILKKDSMSVVKYMILYVFYVMCAAFEIKYKAGCSE